MRNHDTRLHTKGSVINMQNGNEIGRLMHQHHLLTRGMGGLLLEEISLDKGQTVRGLACGPGGWELDVAYTYPNVSVTGVDLSRPTIEYARDQAQVLHLDNAGFLVMDVTRPLDFPDDHFDLVHACLCWWA